MVHVWCACYISKITSCIFYCRCTSNVHVMWLVTLYFMYICSMRVWLMLQEYKALVTSERSWQELAQQSARCAQSSSWHWSVAWHQVGRRASSFASNFTPNAACDVTWRFIMHQTWHGLPILVTKWVQKDARWGSEVDNWQWLWYSAAAAACCRHQCGTTATSLDFCLTSMPFQLIQVVSKRGETSFFDT